MVFFCVYVFVFYCYGSYSKIVIEPYETVAIASVLKNICIFLMYFMGNGF